MMNILHPTDFSDNACKALKYAYELSRKLNAGLRVVHVAEAPSMFAYPHEASFEEMEEQEKDSYMRRLRDFCIESLGTLSAISCDLLINNSVIAGILNAIKESNASMVVVGTRGQSRFREVVMGSTTRKLIAASSCPVLAIPEDASFSEISQIVYTSDFSRHDIAALQKLTAFAANFDVKIAVLHVFSSELDHIAEAENFKLQLAENIKYDSLEYATRISQNIGEALANYLQEIKTDLLVMYEKERGGIIARMFHKDLVKKFATHTSVPLLSFNALSVADDL
jgi:nucleotide-binding universal stress UspA family protein